MDQQLRYEAETVELRGEMSQTQQTSEERMSELQKLADEEKRTLHAKIRFVFVSD